MSTIHEVTNLQHPASTNRQVYSPLDAYWKAFQEWRKRLRLQTELCRLTDRELMDIGTTCSEIDYVASKQPIPRDPSVGCPILIPEDDRHPTAIAERTQFMSTRPDQYQTAPAKAGAAFSHSKNA